MERILLNISMLLFSIYFYKKIRHGLHILQLENYYNDRYLVWLKKNLKKIINIRVIGMLIIPIVILLIKQNIIALGVELLAFLVLIFTDKKVIEKKPFVVTARIRRMFLTLLLIIICVFIAGNMLPTLAGICAINALTILAYIFVYIINLLNRPVEKCIRAKFCRKASNKLKEIPGLKVVGITGSYGKTSTKYIVNTILSQKYNTLMTPESYNTTMGVVRTINEKLNSTHQLFICEMGAKYVGDIKEICNIVNPEFGILTAIGPQHLDTFKGIENVRKTKLELIDSLPENGIAFVNWEDENIRNSKITKNMVKFGLDNKSDYYAKNIEITEKGSTFDVVIPNKRDISIKTKLLGSLNILNIVGAVAIADKLGMTADEIKAGIRFIKPVPHRLELKQNPNGSIIIDDAYNSNTKGAKMALEVLKSFENKQRILITPGIVELGNKSDEINCELGKEAADSSDFVILVGAKQAVPILKGLKDKNYPDSKIYVAKNLQDGLNKMNQIIDNKSVVLLENDLPDNYL